MSCQRTLAQWRVRHRLNCTLALPRQQTVLDALMVEGATAAALGQCSGHCQIATAMRGNCAALSIDVRNTCGAYGYAAAPRIGQA